MRLRLFEYGSIVGFWLLAFASPAWSAQQPAAAPQPAAAQKTAAAPLVIAVTDVIPSSGRALARLREIRNELDADKSIGVVEAGLPAVAQQADEWWQSEALTIQKLRSVQRISDVSWQLSLFEGQVANWNKLLTASSRKWMAEKGALGRLIADWQATQLALDPTAPEAVSNRIAEVLQETAAVQLRFQQKTAQLVAVQGRLAVMLKRLNDIGDEIETARQQSAANLLALDSVPLWHAIFTSEPGPSAGAQFRDGAKKAYKDVLRFYQMSRRLIPVHLAVLLLLAGLFFRLRHLTRKPGVVSPTDAERFVLDRSLASAVLMALLSVPLFYPDAGPQMMRLILIPATIPLLVLLPAIFRPHLRIAIYLLTALYMIDSWRNYLAPQWWPVRILLIAEALLGIAVIYLTLRARKAEPGPSPSRESLYRSLLKVALGLFIAAICANLVGDLTLAEFLFSPLVRTLYLGVVLSMITVVATTFAMLELRSPVALVFRTVQNHGDAVAMKIRRLINAIAVCVWIFIALFNTGVLGSVVNAVEDVFKAKFKLGAAEISTGDIFTFFLVFGTAYVLSRVLRFILAKEIFPRFPMPRGVPDVMELLSRYGILLFGFLLALVSAGVNLSQLTFALSALGVGIGFGLQNIVNNFVCGLILVFEHPIQVGDFVEVGSHFGKVHRIGFRSSSVNTLDGGNVIIPNSELIGNKVMNWSLSDQLRRITLRVPVPFGTDPKRVIELFQAIARSQPDVVAYPAPSAAMETFRDGSPSFLLRCWTRTEKFESVSWGLTLAINNAFQSAGIQIPPAQTEVHINWTERAIQEMQRTEEVKKLGRP